MVTVTDSPIVDQCEKLTLILENHWRCLPENLDWSTYWLPQYGQEWCKINLLSQKQTVLGQHYAGFNVAWWELLLLSGFEDSVTWLHCHRGQWMSGRRWKVCLQIRDISTVSSSRTSSRTVTNTNGNRRFTLKRLGMYFTCSAFTRSLHFVLGIAKQNILWWRPSVCVCLCVCLSLATFLHYCMYM